MAAQVGRFLFLVAAPLLLILGLAFLAPAGAQFAAGRLLGDAQRAAYLGEVAAVLPFWLGIFSTVANLIVAGVAWYAIQFASRQAREARQQAIESEQTRAASLLSEIRRSWNLPDFVESRQLLSGLDRLHRRSQAQLPTIYRDRDLYISKVLLELRATNMPAYGKYTLVLDELEMIGILCRTGMIKLDYVLEIFGGQMAYLEKRLRRFCQDLQAVTREEGYEHPASVYANTLWLFRKAAAHRPFELDGGAGGSGLSGVGDHRDIRNSKGRQI